MSGGGASVGLAGRIGRRRGGDSGRPAFRGGGIGPRLSQSSPTGSRFLRRVVRAEAGERRRQGAGPESTGGAWWLCCGRGRMRLVPQWWENPGCSSGTGVSNLYHPKSHLDPFSTARRSTEAGGGFLQFAPPSPFLEETPSLAPPTSRPRETTEYRVKAACGSRAAGCRPLL
ncbi:SPRY domain-containing SOCS box protein 3 isoform X2 [Sphaerodactylus townsendi]|uniref:SPRY domain-containing SOCS box protein 3 isoform X2 n=1 Tax=Sphaerodactylus townsendi TaxID=933632 RepID=UPI0020265188|nr:SPRY domain-containing SOCS box protein 3 isoform X2 [Sphaerodactylus townsendi]